MTGAAQNAAAVQCFHRGEYAKAAELFASASNGNAFAQAYNRELCVYVMNKDMDTFHAATASLITAEEKGQQHLTPNVAAATTLSGPGKSPSTTENSWFTLNFVGHDAVLYNEAVLFHRKMMYEQAIDRLKGLFRIRDTLQPDMAVKLSVLLYTCYVSLYQVDGSIVKEVETYLKEHQYTLKQVDKELGTHLTRTFEAILPLVDFLRGNIPKAFTDMRIWYETYRSEGPEVDVVYYNNLAVLHQLIHAPGMAMLYLSQAEKISQTAMDGESMTRASGISAEAVGTSYFNHGISLMYASPSSSTHYTSALRCFEVTASYFPHVPIVWLHVAQCCLRTYDETVAQRRALAAPIVQNRCITEDTQRRGDTSSLQTRMVELCVNVEETPMQRDLLLRGGIALRKAAALTSGDLKSTLALRSSIASGLAYVALCERNYSLAYAHCVDFFKLWEEGGKNNKSAALAVTSYQVEALCMMAQPKEALRTLTNTPLSDLIDPPTLESTGSLVKSDLTARNTEALFVNLIMAAVLNGHYQRAQELLVNLTMKSGGKRCLTLLQVYIELAMGNRDKAVDIIRKHVGAPPLR